MNNEIQDLLRDVKDQVLYLNELGVEGMGVDFPGPAFETTTRPAGKASPAQPDKPVFSRPVSDQTPVAPSGRLTVAGGSRLSQMPSLTRRTPAVPSSFSNSPNKNETEMPVKPAIQAKEETLFGDTSQTLPEANETVETIRAEIGDCSRCPLCAGRTQIVHSTGNLQADLMFVGEAPGADEDAQGFPFVGRAGQLLTKIIEAIGMTREEVFIGNINRCRPPGNRQPTPEESETCKPYLLREIAVVRPKVVVVMGNTATQNLLNLKTGITKLRGNFQEYFGVKVMPTFHPAYLLRDPHKKREVWEDMKKVREYLTSGEETR